jgi:hypothetical protein
MLVGVRAGTNSRDHMRGILQHTVAITAITAVWAHADTAWALDDAGTAEPAAASMTVQNGIASYAPVFFADYIPVTALDMVRQVPGFSLSGGDTNLRGLGDSFGNLLINGARPSNKSLSLDTVLQRIPAGDVERIELIQEALPNYDMRGHPRLINVITRNDTGNSGSWEMEVQLSPSGRLGPRGDISYTTSAGDAEITIGINAHTFGNRVRRRKSTSDANGSFLEFQNDNDQRQWSVVQPSLSINWQIDPDSSLRFDGNVEFWSWHRNQISYIAGPTGFDGGITRYETSATENGGEMGSGTATYTRALNETLELETILLARRESWEDGPERYDSFDAVTGFDGAFIVESSGEYEETAFRSTLSFDPNAEHALEFGAETALNARDTSLDIFEDDGTTITPIALPVANTRVEETRSEVFANHVWTIGEDLNLESGLRYEFSEITQTGDAEQTRTFSYPKPSATLTWRQDDQNRLRFSARREVAQLSFRKFASSVDINDNSSTLGNPDYVPQRTWTIEAEWERRFGDEGSFSLVVGHDWIQDLDGWVPITTPTGVFDAPGNIGDGTNLRVTTNLTTPLDSIGLSNATIDVFLEWYNTNVIDPLTGMDRHWSGVREWEFRVDYRQSFPEHQLAWGWDYFWLSDGEVFRANEYRTHGFTDGDLDLYIETTRWGGVTSRLGVNAVINNGDDRERIFYDGSRAAGIVQAVEHRNESMGPSWYAQIRGTF